MNTFLKQHSSERRRLARILVIAVILVTALAHGLDGLGARAAMRLPEEAITLETWLIPSDVIPAVVDPAQINEVLARPDAPRRTAPAGSPKTSVDRLRRQSASRDKRALSDLMGLFGVSGGEQPFFMRSFESFQNCRKFVAINC